MIVLTLLSLFSEIKHSYSYSYADDITLICPSLRDMNCMLKICSDFAENFSLTFNSNKSMCIKFGESVNDREKIMLNDLQIAWAMT